MEVFQFPAFQYIFRATIFAKVIIFYSATAHPSPQAPDKFNPKVNLQTCGIIQMLYETKQIETMTFGKSVIALFSKIEPKTSK